MNAVFLDRDGVINRVTVRNGHAYSPRSCREFEILNGVPAATARLRAARYRVVVVSNQPDIARNKLSPEDLEWMTDEIRRELAVDEVVVCPHDDDDGCTCRKPKPGMLLDSARRWDIDMASSYMIGDNWKDMVAGRAAGCRCILIDAVYNQDVTCEWRVHDLTEAVDIILAQEG